MAGNAAQGSQLQDGPMIDSVTTVADIQKVLHRMLHRIECIETEIISNASGAEQQLAVIRVDVQTLQQTPPPNSHFQTKFDLIDSKTMTPATFGGSRSENFTAWAKKINAYRYTNSKLPGYREALDFTEKLHKVKPIDATVKGAWNWPQADEADSRIHEMLLLITSGEAVGIVESVAVLKHGDCLVLGIILWARCTRLTR